MKRRSRFTAEQFRAELIKRGFDTQKEFALHLGVSVWSVNRWCNGKVPIPRYVTNYLTNFKRKKTWEKIKQLRPSREALEAAGACRPSRPSASQAEHSTPLEPEQTGAPAPTKSPL